MRVVVTGSAGFIGSHAVRALEERGDMVIRADIKTGQDLSKPIEPWMPWPDAIIHLAGTCSTPGSIDDPMGTFRDTVVVAANVMEAARKDRVPVIFTSSVKARDGKTPYGAAKVMSELWAREYAAAYRIPLVINRPGTVYGPGQMGSPESGWIAWFCRARDENLPVIINGDGRQVRDLLHVDDYVRLLLVQLDDIEQGKDTYEGQIWDVGGGLLNAVSVYDMVLHLGLAFTFGPTRYGDSQEYIGSNNVPSWEPTIYWRNTELLAGKPYREV